MTPASTRFVRVGPVRVRVRVEGPDGHDPPLLLIMGIGGHVDMWRPLTGQLQGRKLVTFDFPGTGQSSTAKFPPTMPHNALFVRKLLQQLGIRRADLLGYSWGGLLAQQLAAQHPSTVRRMVLACTGPGVLCVPAKMRVAWGLATPRRYYSSSRYQNTARATYGGRFRTDDRLVAEDFARRAVSPPSGTGYAMQLAASATFSSLFVAPFINARTLILGGTDDPLVRTSNQHILHRLIRNSELQLFRGAGHMLLVERPNEVRDHLEKFLW